MAMVSYPEISPVGLETANHQPQIDGRAVFLISVYDLLVIELRSNQFFRSLS